MKFRIDLKFFLFLILFYFTRQIHMYMLIMFFAIIHELGHLLAGILSGMKPDKFELKPYGFSVSFKLFPLDYNNKIGKGTELDKKKIFVAMAGPMVNFFVLIIAMIFKIKSVEVIYSNMVLFLFNLIPIYPLDGGRVLKSFFNILIGKRRAEKLINDISFIILILLTFLASIYIYQLKNIAIFIAIGILWILFLKEDRIYRKRKNIYKLLEKKY